MSRVKETGGNQAPQSAAAAAMENRLARKCVQMEAGQVMIEEASRHAAQHCRLRQRHFFRLAICWCCAILPQR